EERVRARERRVAAQRDLDGRSEPAQVVVAVGAAHHVRGLGQTELEREPLHPGFVGRGVEQADRGGVAPERGVGEGVDPEQWRTHPPTVPVASPVPTCVRTGVTKSVTSAPNPVGRGRARQPMTTRTSPALTVSPAAARISFTVPSISAAMWFSIFIASSTSSESPVATVWPTSTRSFTIVPCIGATAFPPPPLPPLAAAARGFGLAFLAAPPPGAASAPSGRNSFTSNFRPFTSTGTTVLAPSSASAAAAVVPASEV